jgi:type III pantothenate kinase
MLILIDAGNTRLKWGVWSKGAWSARGALANTELDGLDSQLAPYTPTWVGVSCVAGAAVRARVEGYARSWGIAPYWLQARAELFGLRSRYTQPETLGTDRFAALFACHCLALAPCVMATAGTALTVDALGPDGAFEGGVIVPGAGLMRRSLTEGTAGLAISGGVCQDFPRSTADAIQTGICAALVGSIEALRTRLETSAGRPVPVLIGGGDAALLAPHLTGEVRVVENMVLEGLHWLAKHLDVPGA